METDPLLQLVKSREIIDIASSLIARLEYARLDENHHGLYRTTWAEQLFNSAAQKLCTELKNFDIEFWFSDICNNMQENAHRHSADRKSMKTNWLGLLLQLEMKYSGFILILNNTLELEEKVHDKLAERSKLEDKYNFDGVNYTSQLLRKDLRLNKNLIKS